jgi:hypothetical protein
MERLAQDYQSRMRLIELLRCFGAGGAPPVAIPACNGGADRGRGVRDIGAGREKLDMEKLTWIWD